MLITALRTETERVMGYNDGDELFMRILICEVSVARNNSSSSSSEQQQQQQQQHQQQ